MVILARAKLPAIFHSGVVVSSGNHNMRWDGEKLTARYGLRLFAVFVSVFRRRSCRGPCGGDPACAIAARPSGGEIKLLFQKLGVPVRNVGGIEKRHPFLITGHAKRLLHKWRPLGFERFSYERHMGLLRRPAAFAPVTVVAGTDHILPGRSAILGARHDMIEIQLVPR
jgi:hypothetical protein